jgi:N-acetylmuramoyl-L-alanine amidase
MTINDKHRLEGNGVTYKESPNHGGAFSADLPDTIIIHYTAGASAESAVKTLCDPRMKVSAHLVIGRDGAITQLVPFDTVAWHAGKSSYEGRTGFNKYAIGIEVDNAGRLTKSGDEYVAWFGRAYPEKEVVEAVHQGDSPSIGLNRPNESKSSYWHRYTEEQIAVVQEVCVELMDAYEISSILGHEEIAPQRKTDPGPAFPLHTLRERVLYRDRADEGPEQSPPVRHPGMVTASRLNIRSGPMRSAALIAPPLSRGTMLEIVQENNGWLEVQVQTRGWVKKEYIKT